MGKEQLHHIFRTYESLPYELLKDQTNWLARSHPFSTVLFTRSPRINQLIKKELGFNTYLVKSHRQLNLSNLRSMILFSDDLLTLTIEGQNISMSFPVVYFMETLRQGLNGVLPKMFKEHGVFDYQARFNQKTLTLSWNIEAGPTRLFHLKDLASKAKNFESFTPELSGDKIWKDFFDNPEEFSFTIVKERLKLWNRTTPEKGLNANLKKMLSTLPFNNFGVLESYKLERIYQAFSSAVSNESLLNLDGQEKDRLVYDQMLALKARLKSSI